MINRVTGEIDFRSGLRILPHSRVTSLSATPNAPVKIQTRKLGLKDWRRHLLGPHTSEHGIFEVEALTQADDCIRVVLLSHQHSFYERGTADDAERRAFHVGVIHSDLGGQKEFSWGEVLCHLAKRTNKDWLIVGYSREPRVPAPDKEVLLTLFAHEKPPES